MVTGARLRGRGGCERPDRGDHPARAGVATPGKSRVALADGDASCPEVEPSGAPLCTVELCPCATPRSDRAAVGSHRSLTALGRSRDCELTSVTPVQARAVARGNAHGACARTVADA